MAFAAVVFSSTGLVAGLHHLCGVLDEMLKRFPYLMSFFLKQTRSAFTAFRVSPLSKCRAVGEQQEQFNGEQEQRDGNDDRFILRSTLVCYE